MSPMMPLNELNSTSPLRQQRLLNSYTKQLPPPRVRCLAATTHAPDHSFLPAAHWLTAVHTPDTPTRKRHSTSESVIRLRNHRLARAHTWCEECEAVSSHSSRLPRYAVISVTTTMVAAAAFVRSRPASDGNSVDFFNSL